MQSRAEVVPRYTINEESFKQQSDAVLTAQGYRSDDPQQAPVVCKIFRGGAQALNVAERERLFIKHSAGPFVVKLLDVSPMKPAYSSCTILEKWDRNLRDLMTDLNQNPFEDRSQPGSVSPRQLHPFFVDSKLARLKLQLQVII